MKATGIVRRIDDLGRIVIPKEIRRTMRISEGTPLEIFTDADNSITLKKYSPVAELRDIAQSFADGLADSLGCTVCICDNDTVVAVYHGSRKDYFEKDITTAVARIIWEKRPVSFTSNSTTGKPIPITEADNDGSEYLVQCFAPIVAQGDPVGCVMAFSKTSIGKNESEWLCGARVTAQLLAKQL